MLKTLKKCISIIPYIFLLVSFILIISLAFSLKKGETPTIFNRAIFIVVSPSMEDYLMVGDVIIVDTTPGTLYPGDIISFKKPDEQNLIITHRITNVEDIEGVKYYSTIGDNNSESYDWEIHFSEDLLVGKLVGKSGFVGDVYQYLFSGGVNIIFILIIAFFVIIGGIEVFSIVKEVGLEKERKILEAKEKMIEEELEKLRKEKDK